MRDSLPQVSPPRHLGTASNAAGASFGPRHLGDFEFVWMVEGDATYRVNGRAMPVPAGSVVLCRPTLPGGAAAVDGFDWDPLRASTHAYAHFNVTAVPAGFPPLAAWPWVAALPPGDVWRPMFLHLQSLGAALRAGEPGAAALAGLAMTHLLGSFILGRVDAAAVPPRDVPEPVRLAVAHYEAKLDRTPAAAVTLAELAGAAFVTPAYLCRAFRKGLNTTPLAAVRSSRLDRALEMLTRSNESVGNIAAATGFQSPFHFSRRFKEAFGRGPLAVRRDARAGRTPPLPRRLVHLGEGQRRT